MNQSNNVSDMFSYERMAQCSQSASATSHFQVSLREWLILLRSPWDSVARTTLLHVNLQFYCTGKWFKKGKNKFCFNIFVSVPTIFRLCLSTNFKTVTPLARTVSLHFSTIVSSPLFSSSVFPTLKIRTSVSFILYDFLLFQIFTKTSIKK